VKKTVARQHDLALFDECRLRYLSSYIATRWKGGGTLHGTPSIAALGPFDSCTVHEQKMNGCDRERFLVSKKP
jgi:hypothetical protein